MTRIGGVRGRIGAQCCLHENLASSDAARAD